MLVLLSCPDCVLCLLMVCGASSPTCVIPLTEFQVFPPIPPGYALGYGSKWFLKLNSAAYTKRLTRDRLLLGTLPADKSSWSKEFRQQRENYYVSFSSYLCAKL